MKIAILAFVSAVVIIIIATLGLIGVVLIGYGVGLVITMIPFLPGFLIAGPVTLANIPVITAWLAVAAVMLTAINIKFNVNTSRPTKEIVE